MNAYEAERLANIAKNREVMMKMGLVDSARELATTLAPKIAQRLAPKPRRTFVRGAPQEPRRSGRAAGREPVNYAEEPPRHAYVERARLSKRPRARSSADTDFRGGWHFSLGEAGGAATDRAIAAAEELIAALGRPAYLKVMTQSQVSSGFWSSAAKGLGDHMGDAKAHITLRLAPGTKAVDGEEAKYGERWPVVWLPRTGGDFGLSGGWRTFAMDLDLYPSDVCVFEVEPPASSSVSDSLLVHIFRAFDYESEAVQAARRAGAAAAPVSDASGAASDTAAAAVAGSLALLTSASCGGSDGGGSGSEGEAEGGSRPRAVAPPRRTLSKSLAKGPAKASAAEASPAKRKRPHPAAADPAAKKPAAKKPKALAPARAAAPPQAAAQKQQRGLSNTTKTKPRNPVSKGKRPTQQEATQKPPAAAAKAEISAAGEEEYVVERIVDAQAGPDGQRWYLIKWLGYPASDNTWEPPSSLNAELHLYPRAPGVKL